MSVVTAEIEQHTVVDKSDITRNLPSLQFESALEEGETSYLQLRARSHAISVSMCAQATYFTYILNEAREIVAKLRNPGRRQTQKFLLEGQGQDPLKIGIIGCGRLGAELANCLLTYAEIRPDDLKISTRRPETLSDLKERGIECSFDNASIAANSHLIFLCILPSQLNNIVEDLRFNISPETMIYSFLNSVPVPRISQLLCTDNIIKPEFKWPVVPGRRLWDCSKDILSAFEMDDMIQQTCPICEGFEYNVVWTDSRLCSDVIRSFVNMCLALKLAEVECLEVVHAVVFGETTSEPLQDHLTTDDIMADKHSLKIGVYAEQSDTSLPPQPYLLSRILNSPALREAFSSKYCMLFQRYTQWKNKTVSTK